MNRAGVMKRVGAVSFGFFAVKGLLWLALVAAGAILGADGGLDRTAAVAR